MVKSVLDRYEGKLFAAGEARMINNGYQYQQYQQYQPYMYPRVEAHEQHEKIDEINYISNDPNEAKALIAMAITFLAGIFQVSFKRSMNLKHQQASKMT